MKNIEFPLENEQKQSDFLSLNAGETLTLSGVIYTARDQAHKRMIRLIEENQPLPVDWHGNAVYYCGPTPPREDELFGSAGPTTSARMDPFSEPLMRQGLVCSIGKGARSDAFRESCRKWNHLYLMTYGGAGAYLAKCILKQEVIAFPELGTEAIYRLEVRDFPVVVAYDLHGGSVFR